MKHKILKQNKNVFMHREEILIDIEANINPSFEQVKEIIGKDKDLVVVKSIHGNFGSHSFIAEVFVYDSKENKENIETIPRKIRLKLAEEMKKQAEAKASSMSQAPAA